MLAKTTWVLWIWPTTMINLPLGSEMVLECTKGTDCTPRFALKWGMISLAYPSPLQFRMVWNLEVSFLQKNYMCTKIMKMVQYLASFYRIIEPSTVEASESNGTPTGWCCTGWGHRQLTGVLCKNDLRQSFTWKLDWCETKNKTKRKKKQKQSIKKHVPFPSHPSVHRHGLLQKHPPKRDARNIPPKQKSYHTSYSSGESLHLTTEKLPQIRRWNCDI